MNRSKKELVIRGKGEKTHMNDGIERRRRNIMLPTTSLSDSSAPLPSRIVVAHEDLTADRHGNATHGSKGRSVESLQHASAGPSRPSHASSSSTPSTASARDGEEDDVPREE
jgi:hypothetical protein